MKHRFTAPLIAVLVLALAAFTGTAVAGDGHGSASGSSGNANKKSSTSASQPATGGDNSKGVKPSNTTKHDTYAKASSDQTKQYGNGKTAGQIATQAGHGDATLHGPGNSQPHKTAACPGGHEVDVHALKRKDSKCGTSQETKKVDVDVEKTKKTDVDVEKTKKADVDVEKSKTDVDQAQVAGVDATQTCGMTTQTVTEQVLVGVNHKTGNGKFVLIHPSKNSAHYTGKHKDDIPVYETVTKTITVPATNCPAAPAQSGSQATVTPNSSVSAQAAGTVAPATAAAPATASASATAPAAASAPAAAAPAATGGVKGAVVALKPTKAKPAGGVLGATTRLGGKVAATRLPFTGLPLWIFALVAAGLIGVGLTMRRASANRI